MRNSAPAYVRNGRLDILGVNPLESMELAADRGLRLNAYSAQPGSADREKLDLLAGWAATTTDQRRAGDRA